MLAAVRLICLGSIQANELVKEWSVPIKVAELRKRKINFMIDLGSDLTCVPSNSLKSEIKRVLKKTKQGVVWPVGHKAECIR